MLRRIPPLYVSGFVLLAGALAIAGAFATGGCTAIYTDIESLRPPAGAVADTGTPDAFAETGASDVDGDTRRGDSKDSAEPDPDPGPTCDDGVQNGRETDVDCGAGDGCPKCGSGESCENPGDCRSHWCEDGICK